MSAFVKPGRVLLGLSVLAFLATACGEFNYGSRYSRSRANGPPPSMYIVRPGDTLISIAWRYDLDYRSIARQNGIEPPYTIYPQQRLRLHTVPKRQKTANAATRPPSIVKPEPISKPDSDSGIAWQWPAKGTITQRFHPNGTALKGIKIQGRLDEPIRAAAAGRVVYSGNGLRGYGNLIIIKHSGAYLTAYGYNHKLLVHEGDQVHGGQIIARMGLGPAHQPAAHFEIRREGKPVDPLRYLPSR